MEHPPLPQLSCHILLFALVKYLATSAPSPSKPLVLSLQGGTHLASLKQVVGWKDGWGQTGLQATAGILICFDFWSLERGLATRPNCLCLRSQSRQKAPQRVLETR